MKPKPGPQVIAAAGSRILASASTTRRAGRDPALVRIGFNASFRAGARAKVSGGRHLDTSRSTSTMASTPKLNDAQLAVLSWIAAGTPAGVMEGYGHRTSAAALRSRELIKISGWSTTWRACITPAGKVILGMDTDDGATAATRGMRWDGTGVPRQEQHRPHPATLVAISVLSVFGVADRLVGVVVARALDATVPVLPVLDVSGGVVVVVTMVVLGAAAGVVVPVVAGTLGAAVSVVLVLDAAP